MSRGLCRICYIRPDVHSRFNEDIRACGCDWDVGLRRYRTNRRLIRCRATESALDAGPRESSGPGAIIRLFRYFQPTDAAASADWDQIAIRAVQTVEDAQDASELASSLTVAFGPVSVGVAVFPTAAAQPSVRLKPGPHLIEWRHHGVGLSENNTYYSERDPAGHRKCH